VPTHGPRVVAAEERKLEGRRRRSRALLGPSEEVAAGERRLGGESGRGADGVGEDGGEGADHIREEKAHVGAETAVVVIRHAVAVVPARGGLHGEGERGVERRRGGVPVADVGVDAVHGERHVRQVVRLALVRRAPVRRPQRVDHGLYRRGVPEKDKVLLYDERFQ